MKALIGIGDSWTQGQGGIPLKFWDELGGRVDVADQEAEPLFLHHELENSWVNVLCKKYFTDHTPINLGMRGYGNRGAVKNLYLYDDQVKVVTSGILIFLLSSRVRFDILSPTGYTSGRRKFRTFYPHGGGDNLNKPGEKEWYRNEYTEYLSKGEILLNLVEAQMWAKAHNLQFYFATAFEHIDDLKSNTEEHYNLATQLNWKAHLNPHSHYYLWLNELNGTPDKMYGDYFKMDRPDTYITNDVHPTILGYEKIAESMYNSIQRIKKDII